VSGHGIRGAGSLDGPRAPLHLLAASPRPRYNEGTRSGKLIVLHIHEGAAMQRTLRSTILPFAIALLTVTAFAAGFGLGRYSAAAAEAHGPVLAAARAPLRPAGSTPERLGQVRAEPPERAQAAAAGTPAGLEQEFALFWQVWQAVEQDFYRQPLDHTRMVRGAIKGLLQSLDDPMTVLLEPDASRAERESLFNDTFDGIGAQVEQRDGVVVIVTPLDNSPAQRAGLLPQDVILKVDGADVTGKSAAEVAALIRGPRGTPVTLTIRRGGGPDAQVFDVTITRERIRQQTVSTRMLDGNIAYVRLSSFKLHSASDLSAQLKTLLAAKPRGLVLDLRNNPGGLLSTAVDVASLFLPQGSVVLHEERGNGQSRTYTAKGGAIATDIPLVVLVNKGSASASEIVAGALQQNGRGAVVGESSYGKNTVQVIRDLKDGLALRISIAQWFMPQRTSVAGTGIIPDVLQAPEEAGKDIQLERALELLRR
jgi:carboxyl-terminal processing protease